MSAIVAAEARARVDRIKVGVEAVWHLIVESYQARDWEALGYATWDEMCTREFGTSRLRLPREERAETVQSLHDAGLSYRAIASATGTGQRQIAEVLSKKAPDPPEPKPEPAYEPSGMDEFTVNRETGEVTEDELLTEPEPEPEPKTIIGLDGKSYGPSRPRAQPRKPLVEIAKTRGFTLRQAADSLLKVFEDDRYRSNEKQVADVLRGHLLYVAETVAAVIDQLP